MSAIKPEQYACRVKSVHLLTPTVFQIQFIPDKPMPFLAGQFLSAIIPGAGPQGRSLRRAYSIASAPESDCLELCIKLVDQGPGSHYLYGLRPGEVFEVMAPYGDFTYVPVTTRNACFIATGTGIAPFRSMLLSEHYQQNQPLRAYCFFGVRSADEILYKNDLESIPNLSWTIALSQAPLSWTGFRGRVTDYLLDVQDFEWLNTEYYLCGHGGMIQAVKQMLLGRGVEKQSIHQEIYYK